MTAGSFLIALAVLAAGTYLMRFAGVKLGAAIATKGQRRTPETASVGSERSTASVGTEGSTASAGAEGSTASAGAVGSAGSEGNSADDRAGSAAPGDSAGSPDSTERVTKWMDRATVVLIGSVFATTAIFDGKDIADPARLIGVGVGVLASIVRVPMLLAVIIGMAVCAVIRMTGIL